MTCELSDTEIPPESVKVGRFAKARAGLMTGGLSDTGILVKVCKGVSWARDWRVM